LDTGIRDPETTILIYDEDLKLVKSCICDLATDLNDLKINPKCENELIMMFPHGIYALNLRTYNLYILLECPVTDILSSINFYNDNICSITTRKGQYFIYDLGNRDEPLLMEGKFETSKCILNVYQSDDEHLLIKTYPTTARSVNCHIYLTTNRFEIIDRIELKKGEFGQMFQMGNIFAMCSYVSVKDRKLVLLTVTDHIEMLKLPFHHDEIVKACDDKLLLRKDSSYEWFNIHTYEITACPWLKERDYLVHSISK
jgi:hypothetical protein